MPNIIVNDPAKVSALSEIRRCAAERVVRPCSGIRGSGHVAQILNRWFLRLGAGPIVTARMQDRTSLRVDLRSRTEWFTFWSGIYGKHWFGALSRIAELGGNILDVGANIGFFSVAVGAKMASADQTIIAFEPVTSNFTRLLENVHLNELQTRVFAYPIGLSDRAGETTITLREDFQSGANTGNASIAIAGEPNPGFLTQKIALDTLDAFARRVRIENVSIVKVDIEGHEDRFLAGGRETLGRERPTILLELNKPFYHWRGVDYNEVLLGNLPEDYILLRNTGAARATLVLTQIKNFQVCGEVENVLAVPRERLSAVMSTLR